MISLDCAGCSQPTGNGSDVAVVDKTLFHEACLKCAGCGLQLQDYCHIEFVQKAVQELNLGGPPTVLGPRANVFCLNCTLARSENAEKCDGCKHGFSFSENTIRGIGTRWHECCFRCMNPACKAKITREYFTDKKKNHFCSIRCQTAGPVCGSEEQQAGPSTKDPSNDQPMKPTNTPESDSSHVIP